MTFTELQQRSESVAQDIVRGACCEACLTYFTDGQVIGRPRQCRKCGGHHESGKKKAKPRRFED